ncbi:MAG: polysaccharide biosynthesis tyrosine autokinase [Calditrichaeota bacterium]|nr:polysaccharide biosynthesis tyrosine autokinase [Calditrichota bacterium]MCB9366856.1 polysaccharide biosynthesis tyrosine autokinase [Calditrichota bacterium]
MSFQETTNRFSEYFRILFRGRWIIIGCFFAVVAATTYLTYRMQPLYTAMASVLILDADPVDQAVLGTEQLPYRKTRNLNETELLRSRRIAEDVLRSLADSPYRSELEIMRETDSQGRTITFDDRVATLRGNTSVENLKDTDVLRVSMQAHSAFEAAFLANAIAEEYYRYKLRSARGEVSEIRQFLEQQLEVVRDQLSQSEELERAYKESRGVAALDEESKNLVSQSADMHALYNQTESDLNAELRRMDYLKRQLEDVRGALVEDISNISSPIIETLQREIADKQTRLAALVSNPGPGTDVTIQALENEIETIKGKLVEEVRKIAGSGGSFEPLRTSQELFDNILKSEVEIKALTARAEALREVISNIDYELEQLPEKTLVLARLTRDRKLNEELYLILNEKYEESRISEAAKSAGVEIVDTAKPPEFPLKPRKKLNILFGMLFGLALGVGITLLIDLLDDTIKTPEELERVALTPLGTIPIVNIEDIRRRLKRQGKELTPADEARIESKMITKFSPKSPISEAYRSLRTNIQFSDIDNPKRVILMTSSATKEGKSTTCVNLAITFAQMGSRVLLVDSDLRRPTLHNFFNVDKMYGLSNVLIGSLTLKDVIKRTEVENLDLITAGDIPPNPAEMVASERMKAFLDEARAKYDVVLLDSPPVVAVTDAAILTTRADATIVVVSSGMTGRAELKRAINLIQSVGSHVLGVVLNGLDIKKMYGSYYYYFHYYQYYYYYGSESGNKKKRKTGRKQAEHRASSDVSEMT